MEGLILILVPLALLVGVGAVAAMVLDVTLLGGDRRVIERDRFARRWSPPYVDGGQLLAWARDAGARAADRLLAGKRDGATPVVMSAALHDGATRAMLPTVSDRDVGRVVPCPEGGQGVVGVTAPEALEIADYIRWNMSDEELRAILGRATISADALADLDALDSMGTCAPSADGDRPSAPTELTGCALQGGDCTCLTYWARPLRCRPLHAGLILRARGFGARRDRPDDTRHTRRARLVAEGIEEGMIRALDLAGLDSNVYELNSAVAAALRTPDAARRWLDGEDVFVDCTPAPPSALQA